MEYNLQGIINLRNGIVELAAEDYVKAKKFIIRNANNTDLEKDVEPTYWRQVNDAKSRLKAGRISESRFELIKKRYEITKLKETMVKAHADISSLVKWFNSARFDELCTGIDCETMVYNLDRRAIREIEEEDTLRKQKA